MIIALKNRREKEEGQGMTFPSYKCSHIFTVEQVGWNSTPLCSEKWELAWNINGERII